MFIGDFVRASSRNFGAHASAAACKTFSFCNFARARTRSRRALVLCNVYMKAAATLIEIEFFNEASVLVSTATRDD